MPKRGEKPEEATRRKGERERGARCVRQKERGSEAGKRMSERVLHFSHVLKPHLKSLPRQMLMGNRRERVSEREREGGGK